jgi:hypothetical protein
MRQTTMQIDYFPTSNEDFASLLKALTSKDASKQQPRRKRVRFSSKLSCCSISNKLTREESKSLWYDAQTIFTFRSNARRTAFSMERKAHVEQQEEEKNTRGLEICTFERQLHRHKTIQCILSSCQNGHIPERTAMMAQQCSAWNRDMAILQACHDFFEAHQPHLRLPKICNTPPAFPFQLKRKCDSSSTSHSQIRVQRRRTA